MFFQTELLLLLFLYENLLLYLLVTIYSSQVDMPPVQVVNVLMIVINLLWSVMFACSQYVTQ